MIAPFHKVRLFSRKWFRLDYGRVCLTVGTPKRTLEVMVVDDTVAKSLISENLRALLRQKKMSCRELARATGDAPMTINDAVNGRKMPGGGLLKRMALALNVSVDDLYALRSEKIPALS